MASMGTEMGTGICERHGQLVKSKGSYCFGMVIKERYTTYEVIPFQIKRSGCD